MKKLLSAVTSVVMGLSLMTSAFASSVSAAGSYTATQPNVSMDEVKGVSANRNASAADVVFDFGSWDAKPGDTVEVPVMIDSNGNVVISVDCEIAMDSPLELTGISDVSPAFRNAAITGDPATKCLNFASMTGQGKGRVPSTTAPAFTLTFKVPENCSAGDYHIGFGSKCDVNEDNSEKLYTVGTLNGVIHVGGQDTSTTTAKTPTSTTTKVTTTTPPVQGGASWVIPTVKAKAGEEVKVQVLVKDSDIEVAGATFKIDAKAPVEYKSATGSDAYQSTIVPNATDKEFGFGKLGGEGVKAAEGSTLIELTYNVPSGTAAGTYPLKWSDVIVSDTDGNEIQDKIQLVDGAIEVETVTFDGDIAWVLDKVTAAPGEKVTVKAVVSDPENSKLPVAGAQFKLEAKSPITYSSVSGSDAYGATIVPNADVNEFGFAVRSGEGTESKDGAVVASFEFTVPANCAPGVYPVTWADTFISDTNGNELTGVSFVDGSITVKSDVEGDVSWVIPQVEAKPGDVVTMEVEVADSSSPALAVAGAEFTIDAETPIEYVSASGSDAYSATIVPNDKSKEFGFAVKSGDGKAAEDGAKVIVLTYKVPEDCAAGKYPVTWSNAFISDTNGGDITDKVNLVDGFISVVIDTTTTTLPKGKIAWEIQTVKAKPGETVTVDVLVKDPNAAKLPIAGGQITIDPTAPIVYESVSGSDAYKAAITPNNKTHEFGFANTTGDPVAAEDGAVVMTLTYTVPEDCEAGTYPVTYSDKFISATDGADISEYVEVIEGAIIVEVPTTTTTTTLPKGKIAWEIQTVKAKPGETVTVDVLVKDPNAAKLPIAGGQIKIEPTAPIEYTSVSGSEAYGATVVPNPATLEYAFANKTGEAVAAEDGAVVMSITYTVPEDTAGGTYPVTYSDKFISATDGSDISEYVEVIDGAIIVDAPTTSTSSVTTTESTSTTYTIPVGDIAWEIQTVEAEPGETVTVDVIVKDPNASKLPIAGGQITIKPTAPIEYSSVSGSDAYSATVVDNKTTFEYGFANKTGEAVAAEDGAVVMTLTYTVPEDIEDGTYPVTYSDKFISATDGSDISEHVEVIDGAIIIKRPTTSTTSTITTTTESTTSTESTSSTSTESTSSTSTESTSSTSSESTTSTTSTSTESTSSTSTETTTYTVPVGDIAWEIQTVEAQPGDTVTVDVIVNDPNGT
ncbi:MAG: hypothetical protein IJM38_01800, partial [Ruminococcus sp.]|nr:hypothetical protein [Ruminococcus sp.]